MMLVYSVETTYEDQFLRLAYVFGVESKVDSVSVHLKVGCHCGSDEGKLVGKIDIAGMYIFGFIDI